MSIVTGSGGAFTQKDIDDLNTELARLSAAQAGGTLADGKILVGNGSNLSAARTPSGDLTMSNTGVFTVATLDGKTITKGVGTLDGSNPTTIDTGLSAVDAFVPALRRSTALTSGTAFLTHAAPSGGNVACYGWVLAGTASTGTEDFDWIAIGDA